MSNIPLKCLLGAFAVVSITGCDVTANRGFCQKTDKGYEICIKEENIRCKGDSNNVICEASGTSKDLTGKEVHWEAYTHTGGRYGYEGKFCQPNSTTITCGAARHFGKI